MEPPHAPESSHEPAAPAALEELEQAYQAGDFARVRRRAGELLAQPNLEPEIAAGARAQFARTGVGRTTWWTLAFAGALFCAIVGRYVL